MSIKAHYVDVLKTAVPKAVATAGIDAGEVIGIGTDFTACTVLPTLADRPHAYVKLWKHHAAQTHADRINAVARERGEP